ncbi:MAG: acyclic terpene utilization AtuA family protein [Planctomycetales bacterium]
MRTIRIGNGAGYWGDNLDAPRELVERGELDYLTLEYLAELTLSILAHQRAKDPAAGYVADFPTVMQGLAPHLLRQPSLKIVTNAGGMNPAACARQVAQRLADVQGGAIRVAAVAGDDLFPRIDELLAAGESFSHFDSGRSFADARPQLASANAYLGAEGIVAALRQGARVVITGRVADASLTVGPAWHEFGWKSDDWTRLGGATVAGHLIECGAQVTGGMFSAWNGAYSLVDVGYPIAEISEDGSVVITKPAGTGGAVTVDTVAEQLVYEIGDPAHYLTPDVDADFSQVALEPLADNRVAVRRAGGGPAPARLKVSMAYRDGFMASGTLVVCGAGAEEKARAAGRLILDRLEAAGIRLERTHIECLGTGDSLPGIWPRPSEAMEVVLRVAAHDPSRGALERFVREFSPLAGAGPPGVTGYTGPRVKPYPVFAYWPTTVSRQLVTPTVDTRTAAEWLAAGQ